MIAWELHIVTHNTTHVIHYTDSHVDEKLSFNTSVSRRGAKRGQPHLLLLLKNILPLTKKKTLRINQFNAVFFVNCTNSYSSSNVIFTQWTQAREILHKSERIADYSPLLSKSSLRVKFPEYWILAFQDFHLITDLLLKSKEPLIKRVTHSVESTAAKLTTDNTRKSNDIITRIVKSI